jgi:hypothetical protein
LLCCLSIAFLFLFFIFILICIELSSTPRAQTTPATLITLEH